jgi:transaldolase
VDPRRDQVAELTRERAVDPADLRVKIFADGCDLDGVRALYGNPLISGFTTNPSLMRKSGVSDYEAFARALLAVVPDRPISFEVFADDAAEMERQGRIIAGWGEHVYVKIPVTNTQGVPTDAALRGLVAEGVKVNVTGLMTTDQVRWVADCLAPDVPACVSVFAGRIADTGVDPVPIMSASLEILRGLPETELIWASPRELLNVVQADAIGCDIITVTHDLLKKLPILGRDLTDYSLDTVRMFHGDAVAAGFTL